MLQCLKGCILNAGVWGLHFLIGLMVGTSQSQRWELASHFDEEEVPWRFWLSLYPITLGTWKGWVKGWGTFLPTPWFCFCSRSLRLRCLGIVPWDLNRGPWRTVKIITEMEIKKKKYFQKEAATGTHWWDSVKVQSTGLVSGVGSFIPWSVASEHSEQLGDRLLPRQLHSDNVVLWGYWLIPTLYTHTPFSRHKTYRMGAGWMCGKMHLLFWQIRKTLGNYFLAASSPHPLSCLLTFLSFAISLFFLQYHFNVIAQHLSINHGPFLPL